MRASRSLTHSVLTLLRVLTRRTALASFHFTRPHYTTLRCGPSSLCNSCAGEAPNVQAHVGTAVHSPWKVTLAALARAPEAPFRTHMCLIRPMMMSNLNPMMFFFFFYQSSRSARSIHHLYI